MSFANQTYERTRGRLATYFDGTAHDAWVRLMSDAPVSRIRQTVRAGRAEMRAALLGALPEDLRGARVLDAGCGAGQLSIELARRGAQVVAADISPKLLQVADQNMPPELRDAVTFHAGDMLAYHLGRFDYIVAMDSLIHYRTPDIAQALAQLVERTGDSIHFTVAPRTPALTVMHLAGKLFPRSDRSPAIEPTTLVALQRAAGAHPALSGWAITQGQRVARGFYISQAMEVRPR